MLFCDVLYMSVRYASPSGPVELLFLLCSIAVWTCVVVSVMLVVCSLSVFLYMCLLVLGVLCLTVLVNCLLNAFAVCVDEVNVFSLKVMVFFFVFFGFFWHVRVLSFKEYVCSVGEPIFIINNKRIDNEMQIENSF